jgi:hypothetical protein
MEQALTGTAQAARLGVAMDSVKVTYVGASGRRRARGRTESYWFRPHVTQTIPALDIEAVTGNDPENWRVESPEPVPVILARDTLRQGWSTAQATPRRRGRRRAAATKTETAQPQTGAPVNEE